MDSIKTQLVKVIFTKAIKQHNYRGNAHLCFYSVASPNPEYLWMKSILIEF
jgi:hypothetical protein